MKRKKEKGRRVKRMRGKGTGAPGEIEARIGRVDVEVVLEALVMGKINQLQWMNCISFEEVLKKI
jgi:hypothetical protein